MLINAKEACFFTTENIKFIILSPINQGFLKKVRTITKGLICLTLPLMIFSSCSQEKNTFVSKSYHNTTSRYNAYFLAREKMKEVDTKIVLANVDDYNKILLVFPQIAPETRNTIKTDLEDVIKKASLINENHKNSNWLDDSYIIIGKSYYYKKDYPTAMAFFKFVNSKSKDSKARHAALVSLMRTYIDSADYSSAHAVSDYLLKQEAEGQVIAEENAREFYLTKAYLHQKTEGYADALANLEKALPLINKKDQRARILFIMGQINQSFNKDSAAYENYRTTIKNNPAYELSFNAKLNLAQVTESSKASDNKRVERNFKKLLKDKKNLEYKDKIYYEMAKYELKKGENEKAIAYLEKSLRANIRNQSQKGLSYLKLGEIYYDSEQFENAKVYYDSAVAVWDIEDKRFKAISVRQQVLAEFVGYKQTVQREDSLQKLSKMSAASLDKYLDEVIAFEKEKEKKRALQEEASKKAAARQNDLIDNNNNNNINNRGSGKVWALTSPEAISSGKVEFAKIWGTRKLEDDWRRSQREYSFDIKEEKPKEEEQDISKKDAPAVSPQSIDKINKDVLYKNIPFTAQQIDTSNKRIEIALYNIGKIYNQKLNEQEKAIKTFEDLTKRFPSSEYKAETYYFIHLIYKNKNDASKADLFKNKIFNEFPNSLYAKLLRNPNYIQDNKLANRQAHVKYQQAFDLYKNNSYKEADSLIKIIRIEFPDNDIEDKLTLLSIMTLGQTSNALVYKNRLEEFIINYSSSPLVPKARELLAATEQFINKKTEKGDAIGSKDVKYNSDLKKPHYFAVVLPNKIPEKKAMAEFTKYNNSESIPLAAESVLLSDSTYMIIVKGFEDKFYAQVYINKLKTEKSFFKDNGYSKYPVFIITNNNFQLFLNSKDIETYLKFYKEKY
jgi:tetratricopeptide (TPR) repeat protein